jgi:acetyl-CoA synthetase
MSARMTSFRSRVTYSGRLPTGRALRVLAMVCCRPGTSGCRCSLTRDVSTPCRAFALIEKYGIRNSSLSPCDLQRMMEAVPDPRSIYDLDLRTLVSAGGPVAAAVSHWAREKLGVTINEIFGQTEMGDMLGNCASRWPVKPGAMGRPYPGHRLAIVDHQGQVLPPGELGELAVHRQCNGEDDPLVMLGYWQNPEATARKFIAEGWVLTGELAKIDADGNFWYQGRAEEPFHPGGQPMHG